MANVTKQTFPCPTCKTDLVFTPKVTIKAHLHSAYKDVDGDGERDSSLTQAFQCPDCHNLIQVRYTLEIKEVFVPSRDVPVQDDAPKPMSLEQVALMRKLRETGLIDAFSEVVISQYGDNGRTPKNMETYFLSFIDKLVPEHPSHKIVKAMQDKFARDGNITFWKNRGIVMVVTSRGGVRMFYEAKHSLGYTPELKLDGVTVNRGSALGVRGCRFGLVPAGAKIFLAALKQSLGSRGREMASVPLR